MDNRERAWSQATLRQSACTMNQPPPLKPRRLAGFYYLWSAFFDPFDILLFSPKSYKTWCKWKLYPHYRLRLWIRSCCSYCTWQDWSLCVGDLFDKRRRTEFKISDERHRTENISVGCEMTKTFLPLVNGWVVNFATSAGKLEMIVYWSSLSVSVEQWVF